MTIVPKSGCPVLGQTAVNSGQVISISYSRFGNWLGNVSTAAGMASPRDQGRSADRYPIDPGTDRRLVSRPWIVSETAEDSKVRERIGDLAPMESPRRGGNSPSARKRPVRGLFGRQ